MDSEKSYIIFWVQWISSCTLNGPVPIALLMAWVAGPARPRGRWGPRAACRDFSGLCRAVRGFSSGWRARTKPACGLNFVGCQAVRGTFFSPFLTRKTKILTLQSGRVSQLCAGLRERLGWWLLSCTIRSSCVHAPLVCAPLCAPLSESPLLALWKGKRPRVSLFLQRPCLPGRASVHVTSWARPCLFPLCAFPLRLSLSPAPAGSLASGLPRQPVKGGRFARCL